MMSVFVMKKHTNILQLRLDLKRESSLPNVAFFYRGRAHNWWQAVCNYSHLNREASGGPTVNICSICPKLKYSFSNLDRTPQLKEKNINRIVK